MESCVNAVINLLSFVDILKTIVLLWVLVYMIMFLLWLTWFVGREMLHHWRILWKFTDHSIGKTYYRPYFLRPKAFRKSKG